MTFPNRRNLLGLLALAALPMTTMAQPPAYPAKPVELVVPYPAGGVGHGCVSRGTGGVKGGVVR